MELPAKIIFPRLALAGGEFALPHPTPHPVRGIDTTRRSIQPMRTEDRDKHPWFSPSSRASRSYPACHKSLRSPSYCRELVKPPELQVLRELGEPQEPRELQELRELGELRERRELGELGELRKLRDVKELVGLRER